MPRNWTLWNDAIEKQPTQSSFKFERPGECKRRTWVQPQKAMWQRVWFLLQESNSWLTATLHLSKPNDKPYLEEKTLRMHETCFSSDLIYTNTVRCVVTISPNQLSHQAEIFCHYLFSINVASRAIISFETLHKSRVPPLPVNKSPRKLLARSGWSSSSNLDRSCHLHWVFTGTMWDR